MKEILTTPKIRIMVLILRYGASCATAKTQGSQINDLTHTHTDSGGLEKFQDKDMKTDTP